MNPQIANRYKKTASFIQTLLALFIITRPLNVLIAGLSIFAAATLVEPFKFTLPVVWAMLSTMLITAGANVINDWCDLDIDRINRPQRMLPSGRLSSSTALRFTIFLFACGIFFSIFINETATAIAVVCSMVLIVYSLWLKRQPLSGNLAVSVITAAAFLYGAYAAQIGSLPVRGGPDVFIDLHTWHRDWRAGIFPAVFAFFLHFGREVIKDIEDQMGDKAVQARTLPLAHGLGVAQSAATIAFILLAMATCVPFYLGLYGKVYLWIILLGVDSVLFFAVYFLWKQPAPHRMRQISAALKADMLVGLAAIYFGR
jgi:geranylgeranylglycerol-phosphate geranylgeranyltransferase